jgi:hypothetical protein
VSDDDDDDDVILYDVCGVCIQCVRKKEVSENLYFCC